MNILTHSHMACHPPTLSYSLSLSLSSSSVSKVVPYLSDIFTGVFGVLGNASDGTFTAENEYLMSLIVTVIGRYGMAGNRRGESVLLPAYIYVYIVVIAYLNVIIS